MVVDDLVADPMVPVAAEAARILVVDDEEAVLLTVSGVLELDGYSVSATTSAADALELLNPLKHLFVIRKSHERLPRDDDVATQSVKRIAKHS